MNSRKHRQIMGTETEWDIGVRRVGEPDFQALSSANGAFCNADIIKNVVPEGVTKKGDFLSNGARFYMDINHHPEYATPENTSMKDLLASERAGERILAHGLHRMLIQNDRVAEVVAMKRVIDSNGEAIGYHLNVSEDRDSITNYSQIHPLAWHYATSLPVLGSGTIESYLARDEYGDACTKYRYSWGQKILRIVEDINGSTTAQRPFINTRDESHTVTGSYRRIHIVGNDTHVLEWPAWMLFGTTSLILAACRQGRMRQFTLANNSPSPAVSIAHNARYDLEDSKKYGLTVNGEVKYYTANEINMMIIEDAGKVVDKTDEQQAVYDEWVRAAEDRQRDVMSLSLRSDAVTKLASIRRKQAKRGSDVGEFQQEDLVVDQKYMTVFRATREEALEKTYDQIYDSSPVAALRRKVKSPAVGLTDEMVLKRVREAPETTRASIRSYFIRKQRELNLIAVDWKYCKVRELDEDGNGRDIKYHFDPLDGTEIR